MNSEQDDIDGPGRASVACAYVLTAKVYVPDVLCFCYMNLVGASNAYYMRSFPFFIGAAFGVAGVNKGKKERGIYGVRLVTDVFIATLTFLVW